MTCAASGSWSAATSTSRSTATARSPTTAGSGPRCRRSPALAEAGARVIVCAHLGRPEGRAGGEVLPAPGRRPPGRAARPAGGVRHRHGGRAPRRTVVAGLGDGDVAAAGEPPVQPGRDRQGRRRARRLRRRRSPRSPTPSSATGSASCTASRPACTTSRRGCRTPAAAWSLAEVEVLRRLTVDPERPYAVVLGGAKVSDKLAVIANLLQTADRLLVGGGHGLHVPGRPGPRGRQEPARGRPGRHGAGATSPTPPSAASRSCCRPTSWPPTRSRPTRSTTSCPPTRSRPTGWAWTSAPSPRAAVRRPAGRRPDGLLERPDGGVRDGAVRRGHPRHRAGAGRGHRLGRAHRRRRRRLGRRRAPARLHRRAVRAHLHRWRGQPGVPRGQGAARA